MTAVRKLPRDPGPAGWNAILPAADPAPPLESRISADWLVIGAGFAGLAAARRLGQLAQAARIVVLDAVRVGEGPAGRNSGFMIDLPHDLASADYGGGEAGDRAQIRANRAAIDFALDAAQEYDLGDEAIIRCGKVNGAAGDRGLAHNAAYGAHLAALGEEHRVLDRDEMAALTGTEFYAGGLFTPHAAMIQPAMFVRGVAAGLRSNRVSIHETSPVTSLTRQGGDWVAETPSGAVTAPRVILAVNGHAQSFGYFERRLMHVFTYASMTRALTPQEVVRLGGAPRWALTPSDPMGTTVRRISGTGGDRIVIRNRFTYDPSMEVSDRRIAAIGRDHDRAFAARFPMLAGVEMAYRWGGRLCLSRNDAPAFGEVEKGLFAACCQNGLGTAKGTAAGIAAADLACGEDSALARHFSAADQPVRLPPEPIARIGAGALIRWTELRAGAEL